MYWRHDFPNYCRQFSNNYKGLGSFLLFFRLPLYGFAANRQNRSGKIVIGQGHNIPVMDSVGLPH
jgi:hypothetical protein